MKLIKKLGTRKSKTGKSSSSYGIFKCTYCKKEVERALGTGKQCKSCGCAKAVLVGIGKTKHGDSNKNAWGHRLYLCWQEMHRRCFYPKHPCYKYYGGRGITVCEGWNSYLVFKKWAIENGWEKGLQIDRIDNDGNYEPSNCRFVTSAINSRNRSTTKLSMEKAREIRGKYATGKYTYMKLAKEYGVSYQHIGDIINNKRWKEGYTKS